MDAVKKPQDKKLDSITHDQLAGASFAAAASMGISDRHQIEELTRKVIEHLELELKESPSLAAEKVERATRAAARETGISDEHQAQELVRQVIKRLGQPQPLPGWENLVPRTPRREKTPEKREDSVLISPIEVSSTSAVKLTENARRVLQKRYLKKDRDGNPLESPEDMLRRVARTIARAELIYNPKAEAQTKEEEFYQVMTALEFLPNSPTLMNAGRELGQLSACFVLPIEDSMESIFDAVKFTALIHKSGGGTGFSFSRLRPENDRVGTTGGVASGPVSFMRAFDTATDVIKQGGMRRGANMGILNIDHPDIMKFITAKEDGKSFTNFNISVAVTSRFMEAVKKGADYDLVNPHTKEVVGRLNARAVFDKIVDMAWKTGDPGIIFLDRINQFNPTPHLGYIESTNPCGEQPLLPYESCNLGSINLALMLKMGRDKKEIDYSHLARVVKTAVNFLDNVIDVNRFPLPAIEEMTKKTRKIGLGVMGYADMLILMGIPYDSEEAVKVASSVMKFISEEARGASIELARVRGVFPTFAGSIYDVPSGLRVRNAALTTIAPTGTISIIAGASSGIEPLFALSYVRNILDGAQLVEVNPYFEKAAKDGGFYSEELMKKLATGTRLHTMPNIPEQVKRVFVTAHDIAPEWHVRKQAAFQRYVDNAVSKTVNLPNQATREDVAKVYMMAYQEGLKGITIYRDGSREAQVLTTTKAELKPEAVTGITPRKRAKITHGITEMVNTGCGHLYVTVNSDEKGIFEVFSQLGKAGGCATAQLEATARLISLAFRAGVDVGSIVKQLKGIRCPSIAWEEGKAILSCADAIASVLEKCIAGYEGNPKSEDDDMPKNMAGQCPDCGNLLVFEEGCFKCQICGYTKC